MIKAPYNFIPCSEIVYTPSWSGEVSHDQPFEDGVCGRIDYVIKAQMPIFIKDGKGTQKQNDNKNNTTPKETESFFKLGDTYAIPGSSIKGMIRNIFEIMTFSGLQTAETTPYAYRDWENENLYNKRTIQNNLRCGYIRRDSDGKYYIADCGKKIHRISHTEIDKYIDSSKNLFKTYFSSTGSLKEKVKDPNDTDDNNTAKYDPKTSLFKYKLCESKDLKGLKFSTDNKASTTHDSRLIVDNDGGDIDGRIVLTGQPSLWETDDLKERKNDQSAGKLYEFVFKTPMNYKRYNLSEEKFNIYKAIYSNSKDREKSDIDILWSMYEQELNDSGKDSGIPVFYRIDPKTQNLDRPKVLDFGLAYLYKILYESSPHDRLPEAHKDSSKLDMAKTLFGTVDTFDNNGTKESVALKGRVQFGHAIATSNVKELEEKSYVLSNPKPTYYPTYINQENLYQNRYKTYNDGRLSGWKRYINRATLLPSNAPESDGEDVITTFKPLDKGVEFKGSIYIHNLKEVELGALLSAITLHNNSNAFHQIGKAKAFGYGRIKLSVDNMSFEWNNKERENKNLDKLLGLFEYHMGTVLGHKWIETPNIKELATLTQHVIATDKNNIYQHMSLDPSGINEFSEAKDNNKYIKPLSTYNGVTPYMFSSLINNNIRDIYTKNNELESTIKNEYTNSIITPLIKSKLKAVADRISSFKKQYDDLTIDNLHKIKELKELSKLKEELKRVIKVLNSATKIYIKIQKSELTIYNELNFIRDISDKYLSGGSLVKTKHNCDTQRRGIEEMKGGIKDLIEKHEKIVKDIALIIEKVEENNSSSQKADLSDLDNAKSLRAGVAKIDNYRGDSNINDSSDLETIKDWLVKIAPKNNRDRKKHLVDIQKTITKFTSVDFVEQCKIEIEEKFKK